MAINYDGNRMKYLVSILQPVLDSGRLLDVGCNIAKLKEYLPSTIEYIGIDNDSEALEIAAKKANVRKVDLNKGIIPFESIFFDYVVCSDTLEHLLDPGTILMEITRVLKVDGTLIISLPNDYNLRNRIRILLNKPIIIESYTWDNDTHLHFPTIKQSKSFIAKFITISKVYYYSDSYSGLYLPKKLRNGLAKILPSLFARTIFVIGRKKNSGD